MTFQFSPGKNLRKRNEECVTLEKRQRQWCFLSVKPFPITKEQNFASTNTSHNTLNKHTDKHQNGSSPGPSFSRMNLSTTTINDSFLVTLYYNICSPRTMSMFPGVTWRLVSGLPKIWKFKNSRILIKCQSICLQFMEPPFVFSMISRFVHRYKIKSIPD